MTSRQVLAVVGMCCPWIAQNGARGVGYDFDPPPDLGQTWVEIDGQIYGAKPDETGPIGGGTGYQNVLTDGDYRVSTIDQLREALEKAKPGQVVYVEEDADIDCTTLVFAEKLKIEIPGGVTLAGNRGHQGSKGGIIYSDAFAVRPLMRTLGPDVRITGLRVRGPDPKRRRDHHRRSFRADRGDSKVQHKYYYKFPVSEGIVTTFPKLEIDNCEFSGWSHAAIHLSAGTDHHIHHNYIHHNQMNGLGYGVCHGYGSISTSLIEFNLFDYNRHSIAGTGKPGNRYIARHNVEAKHSLSHNFDMHGGRDRKDGTNIAGDFLAIYNNTFRNGAIRAVAVRGVPREKADIHHNWFFHSKPGSRLLLPWPAGAATKVELHDNAYGQDAPVLLDVAYKTFDQAFSASRTAVNPTAVRIYLDKAIELAVNGAERSRARTEIGHTYYLEELYAAARLEYEKVLEIEDAAPECLELVRKRLKSRKIRKTLVTDRAKSWCLVYSDDFEGDSLGKDWKVISGNWKLENGMLASDESAGGKVILLKHIKGFHRLEFDAVSNAKRPCDLSPFIHSNPDQTDSSGASPGYMLQFGASGNTVNIFRREGERTDCETVNQLIECGKVHKIVAEFDGSTVQLIVDGTPVLQYRERIPLPEENRDMVGIYIYSSGAVDNVRVYAGKGGSNFLRRLFGR